MCSKLALFAAATMAVFVSASPGGSGNDNSCNGGQVYCCNDLKAADSAEAKKAIKLAGIDASISGTVGLTCTLVSTLTISKQACTSQSACCTGTNYKQGAVVVGCSPISLSVS